MDRERLLAGGAVLLVGIALLAAAVAPGVLADPRDEGPIRPGRVAVVDDAAVVSTGGITGQYAELVLHTPLRHDGNPTENVSVRYRAIDTGSGLLVDETRVRVGTMTGDGERRVNGTLRVPRDGGYRLEATVYRNDSRVDGYSQTVRGVSALTPAYARSNVSFTEDAVLDPVSVAVVQAGQNRTTLELGGWLTAMGPSEGSGLSVTFVVRQAESNVVAARSTVDVGSLRAGRSEMVTAEVTVPGDYNYYIDVVLTRDGVIIDTAAGVVNLDPTETISRNQTRQEVEFEAGDFEERQTETEFPRERATETVTSTPGFGPVVAVVALLAAVLFGRWRR